MGSEKENGPRRFSMALRSSGGTGRGREAHDKKSVKLSCAEMVLRIKYNQDTGEYMILSRVLDLHRARMTYHVRA